jgi:hypothetical protein
MEIYDDEQPRCFFCDAPCDESEVCEACRPKACAVLARVVDSCLAGMRGESNTRSNVHGA